MAKLINGKEISQQIKDELKEKASALKAQGKNICLAVIQVGNDPASSVYVGNKKKACEYIGFNSLSYELEESTTEEELLNLIKELYIRKDVNGILVQLPLPKHINEDKGIETIDAKKDVDGFHPMSVGALSIGKKGFISCTPYGIIELLKRSNIDIDGKECVVIGRSNIVGKPLAQCLLNKDATVTVCHSKTQNLEEITRQADILLVAIGKPEFVTAKMVKEGATVIDIGINRNEEGKLVGDVKFDEVSQKVQYISPVPGGVGPMTIAMLLNNVIKAAKQQNIGG